MKIFCNLEDIKMDPEGNIVLFLKKEHDSSRDKTYRYLQDWKGKEVIICIYPLLRRGEYELQST
ncbi:MAG: hypothetical protein DRI61_00870 [Chloroflexi bacterium]|nr:MAG: hypothetical protein DRI61_00870 [Chloroflexota bacterium]